MTNYQTENEIQRAVVEWRGAGEAVAHAAAAIADSFYRALSGWAAAARAIVDAAEAVERAAAAWERRAGS